MPLHLRGILIGPQRVPDGYQRIHRESSSLFKKCFINVQGKERRCSGWFADHLLNDLTLAGWPECSVGGPLHPEPDFIVAPLEGLSLVTLRLHLNASQGWSIG